MNELDLKRKSDPRYDEDLINKKYFEKTLNSLISQFEDKVKNVGLTLYPVGSIYISTNDTEPKNIIGGTWERIKDTFLLCAGDSYSAGSTNYVQEATVINNTERSSNLPPYLAVYVWKRTK